ncbi:cytochrome c-type biogenesis protein [Methylocystis sp. B8]|uniref:cytochrome c-type biogenesis protein n=1 Tax=Methylocystis sp. B8 TaxID=544938 RepID=UPI0032B1A3E8
MSNVAELARVRDRQAKIAKQAHPTDDLSFLLSMFGLANTRCGQLVRRHEEIQRRRKLTLDRYHQNQALHFFFIAMFILLGLGVAPGHAVTPGEMLSDPALEGRARVLSQDLRCVVCQNQSIDDSNAPLAHDLRVLLRERLTAGDSDRQAVDYIVARYGNFVLLKPPMQLNTLPLWAGPVLFLLFALISFSRYLRRRAVIQPIGEAPQLSASEQARLDALLNKRGSK